MKNEERRMTNEQEGGALSGLRGALSGLLTGQGSRRRCACIVHAMGQGKRVCVILMASVAKIATYLRDALTVLSTPDRENLEKPCVF